MLQFIPMKYRKGVLLYQDKPEYGLALKLIIAIVPIALLVGSLHLSSSGERSGSLALLVEALCVGLLFWAIFPRAYEVYEDHLRIVLGGPFSVSVSFAQIKEVRISSRPAFTINFVTSFGKSCVEIAKKRGPSIAITPREPEQFVENANRALSQWTKSGALYTLKEKALPR